LPSHFLLHCRIKSRCSCCFERKADQAYQAGPAPNVVADRSAVVDHCAAVDHCGVADHSAVVDRSAVVDHCAAADRSAVIHDEWEARNAAIHAAAAAARIEAFLF
jgi:hypothetical protein